MRYDSVGDTGAAAVDAGGRAFAANVVFTTSTTYAPLSLGGLAGADEACAERAAAAGLPGR